MGAPENYYAAPIEGPALPIPLELPATFTAKFTLALQLYFGNFLTLSAVILTVWLPLNILTRVVFLNGSGSQDPVANLLSTSTGSLLELIFGPIVAGAVIWIVRQRTAGNPVAYGAAMRAGFRSWGAIFAARFVAWLFILLGFIALIVPGIWLAVSFALIDQVAAVENPGYLRSRSRSAELVNGQFWQILLVFALAFSLGLLIVVVTSILEVFNPGGFFKNSVGNLVVACVVNIVTEIPTCLFTVYYLEAASRKPVDEMPQASHPLEIHPSENL